MILQSHFGVYFTKEVKSWSQSDISAPVGGSIIHSS